MQGVPVIALDAAAVRFGGREDGVQALLPTSLAVEPGEVLVLIGPSGCGKTTLMRLMAGLHRPTAGRVAVRGRNGPSLADPADADADVGVVFQDASLLPWMTIEENVALPLRLAGVAPGERRRRARELCRLVDIEGFEARWPRELSGGMQQRAAIARALAREPAILLMDEPFGALDALTRDQMNLELQRIGMATGCTIVLVTHSITEAVFLADRVACLTPRPGRVVEVVDVPFPRPRSLALVADPAFQALSLRLRSLIGKDA